MPLLVTFNLVTICFQFYCEELRFVLNLKCSNLKITMSFEPQHVSSTICKLVKFKIAEIHIPDDFVFTSTWELSSTLKILTRAYYVIAKDKALCTKNILQPRWDKQGRQHRGTGGPWPPSPHFFSAAKRKNRNKGKSRKDFKAETVKRLSPGLNV